MDLNDSTEILMPTIAREMKPQSVDNVDRSRRFASHGGEPPTLFLAPETNKVKITTTEFLYQNRSYSYPPSLS